METNILGNISGEKIFPRPLKHVSLVYEGKLFVKNAFPEDEKLFQENVFHNFFFVS